MSIQIVLEHTLENTFTNSNLQKFYIVLQNEYPIQKPSTVISLVTEDTRPARMYSHSDVKIFTLFVKSRKHFVLAFCTIWPPEPQITVARPVLLAFLGAKAYCS